MGIVHVDNLKSGMILASDLLDAKGRFLLKSSTILQDKHIQTLKIWGITEADIVGFDQQKAAEIAPQYATEVLNKCESYVSKLFIYSNSEHEAIRELKRLRVLHLARKLTEGENLPELEYAGAAKGDIRVQEISETLLSADRLLSNIQIASFPDTFYRITKVINDPKSSAFQLAEVISKDAGLSAKLLRIANSAFYGLPSKVDSVRRAITLIGINEISTLATGVLAIRFFKGIPQKLIDMKSFWFHSLACGTLAGILARNKTGLSEERFFVGGLLHDIGRLIISTAMPQHTMKALIESRKRQVPLNKIEKEIFGYDHATVAALLLKKWGLPAALESMVKFHHEPANASNPLDASVIHFANIMSIANQFGDSGEIFVPPLNYNAWEQMSASPSALATAISQTERIVKEIIKDFTDE